jgi:hypothetical protein
MPPSRPVASGTERSRQLRASRPLFLSWPRAVRPSDQSVPRQDLAYCATVDSVGLRQVTDCVTSQIRSHQIRLNVLVEVNLSLSGFRQPGSSGEPNCALTSDNAVKKLQTKPCVRVRKRVQETLNLLHWLTSVGRFRSSCLRRSEIDIRCARSGVSGLEPRLAPVAQPVSGKVDHLGDTSSFTLADTHWGPTSGQRPRTRPRVEPMWWFRCRPSPVQSSAAQRVPRPPRTD